MTKNFINRTMTNISNIQELETALKAHTINITIKDENFGNAVVLAGRIQNETLNTAVLKHITHTNSFRIALGSGITIQVKKDLVDHTFETLNLFDSYKTEIDIEDVKAKKINLYYNA